MFLVNTVSFDLHSTNVTILFDKTAMSRPQNLRRGFQCTIGVPFCGKIREPVLVLQISTMIVKIWKFHFPFY